MEWTLPSVDSSSVCACTGMQVMARKGCSKLTAHKHVQQRKSQHNANMQCTHCFVCCNTEPIQGSCHADVADQEIGLGVGRPGDHRKTLYGIRVAQIACTKDKLHTATPECTMRYMHAVHLHVLCQGISNCIANKRNIRFMPINVHVCIRLLSEGLLP
jgi:hypothetical protein